MEGTSTPTGKPVIGGARGILASFTGLLPPRPPSFGETPISDEESSAAGTGNKKRKNKEVVGNNEPSESSLLLSSIPNLVEETDIEGIVAPYNMSDDARSALDLPKMPTKAKNAYLFFATEHIELLRQEHPGLEMKYIMTMIGEKWKVRKEVII